jgi:hypothetical protein
MRPIGPKNFPITFIVSFAKLINNNSPSTL